MIRKLQFVFFSILILVSCSSEPTVKDYFATDNSIYETEIVSVDFKLDSLEMDLSTSSYSGFISYSDQICFVDTRFCRLNFLDFNGRAIASKLGQGSNIDEVNAKQINRVIQFGEKWCLLGSTNDIHFYDRNFRRTSKSNIDWKGSAPYGKANTLKTFTPSEPVIYSEAFGNTRCEYWNGKVYFPIYSELADFNGMTSETYYKESRIIAEIDVSNESNIHVSRLLGRRTPELLEYNYVPQLSFCDFDIDSEGNFYVSHEIDSVVYVYNNDFDLLYSFGVSGNDMMTDYQELNEYDVKRFRELFYQQKLKEGHYTSIKIFDEGNLVFRTYNKGGSSVYDGLQIYLNKKLISDVDVPKGLTVEHRRKDTFYSNIFIDDIQERSLIYSFTLEIPNTK
jgi:hypothetical protein